MKKNRSVLIAAVLLLAETAAAAQFEEFRVKRESTFEFTEKPVVDRRGDRVTISFETKSFCDATVAIENKRGEIVRHLASGVLGPNAPAAFQKGSKKQKLVWDGKDDQGAYVDNKKDHTVRVSLGLKPVFERNLYWSPRKHTPDKGDCAQVVCARPEGVYVYHSSLFDNLRLFDHEGNYLKTIYPFPEGKVSEAKGILRHTFPHDKRELPLKTGFYQSTLLYGKNLPRRVQFNTHGFAGSAMAIHENRIALVGKHLARLGTDGTTAGFPIAGPKTSLTIHLTAYNKPFPAQPWSAAFSPDGKWLYLSALGWRMFHSPATGTGTFGGVMRMRFEKDEKPEVFVGTMEERKFGSDNKSFHCAAGVAVDAKGRVYVADHWNHRIQVYSPDAKYLKTLKVNRPALISIHHKTQEIYAFTLPIHAQTAKKSSGSVQPRLTRFTALDDGAKQQAAFDLPLPAHSAVFGTGTPGMWYRAELDSWSEPPTLWLSQVRVAGHKPMKWEDANIIVARLEKDKAKVIRTFGKEVKKAVKRTTPAPYGRQRLYVNPATGKLWVGEADGGVGKSFKEVLVIDPKNGKIKTRELPFDVEDLCFDLKGRAYLRTGKVVARYDSRSWREVPWDYGEERVGVGFDKKRTSVISALATPGSRTNPFWHLGGMAVSVKGHLVVHTYNGKKAGSRQKRGFKGKIEYAGRPYTPKMYPGRFRSREIHVFDQHGKVIVEDAFPGMGHINGIWIDRDDNLYVMASGHRLVRGKKYDPDSTDDLSETLIKAKAGKAKVLSAGKVPVPLGDARPKRPADIHGNQAAGGTAWVENADWFYGGLGFAGMNAGWAAGGCCCWNARFTQDYFARSFAPELRHFSVAVLDTAGNLILRVGRYGNVDDGKPMITEGGPPDPRSIGGDEVSLFHAPFVATHTDRRLFIADPGNARILSVKLGYHEEAKVSLKDVIDKGAP